MLQIFILFSKNIKSMVNYNISDIRNHLILNKIPKHNTKSLKLYYHFV